MTIGRRMVVGLLAVALTLGLVAGRTSVRAYDGQPPVIYPGTAQIPPHGSVYFAPPLPPPSRIAPSAPPPYLDLVSQSDQPTTATYDGKTLTIIAPAGYNVLFVSGCSGVVGNPASCRKDPCTMPCFPLPTSGTVTFTTAMVDDGNQTLPRGGGAIPYPAGWNLVAGFTGAGPKDTIVSGADGPLFTFQADDTDYEVLPASTPLEAGLGYWVHFSQPTSIAFPQAAPPFAPVSEHLPAGQFVMIGDPFPTTATVSGADAVCVYDPATGYQRTTMLQAGQGAWAISAAGATLTIISP